MLHRRVLGHRLEHELGARDGLGDVGGPVRARLDRVRRARRRPRRPRRRAPGRRRARPRRPRARASGRRSAPRSRRAPGGCTNPVPVGPLPTTAARGTGGSWLISSSGAGSRRPAERIPTARAAPTRGTTVLGSEPPARGPSREPTQMTIAPHPRPRDRRLAGRCRPHGARPRGRARRRARSRRRDAPRLARPGRRREVRGRARRRPRGRRVRARLANLPRVARLSPEGVARARAARHVGGGDGAAHRPRRRPRRDGRLPPPLPRAGRPAPDAAGVLSPPTSCRPASTSRATASTRTGAELLPATAATAGALGKAVVALAQALGADPAHARGRAAGVGGRAVVARGSWNLLSDCTGGVRPLRRRRRARRGCTSC